MTPSVRDKPLGGTKLLAWTRALVEPPLRVIVDRLSPSMRHVCRYHFGWWDAHGQPAEHRPGRAIRPALVLGSARAVGGQPADAIPAAVAVELLHNAALLHDDIIGDDPVRRRRPAAWSAFGAPAAILAGDELCCLAMQALAEGARERAAVGIGMLADAFHQVALGEYADVAFKSHLDVTLHECLAMAEARTSALTECACGLGAWYGDGSPYQAAQLRGFGHHLGIACQLADDLRAIWGDADGPHPSALGAHRKSLPVAAALATDCAAARELALLYRLGSPLSGDELRHAAALVEAAGGRNWAIRQARRHTERALDHLRTTALATDAVRDLTALTELVIDLA
ncbi:polyprenyl synthetase family protein [Amycolatopsis anabasis]|uniref:polyprenyl synthetase family protein n=1 Tax=Amycolatopsis anabasis TaxID=1840409 RepID=UPI00131DCAC1|nr:polyprenyl synthetase family protein [Amycolatopsis anabasis]